MALPITDRSFQEVLVSLRTMATRVERPARITANVLNTLLYAGQGAVTTALFTSISPLGGAFFGATLYASSRFIYPLCGKFMSPQEGSIINFKKVAMCFFLNIGVTSAICTSIGIPISFTGGILLSVGMTATYLSSIALVAGALGSSALAALASQSDTILERINTFYTEHVRQQV